MITRMHPGLNRGLKIDLQGGAIRSDTPFFMSPEIQYRGLPGCRCDGPDPRTSTGILEDLRKKELLGVDLLLWGQCLDLNRRPGVLNKLKVHLKAGRSYSASRSKYSTIAPHLPFPGMKRSKSVYKKGKSGFEKSVFLKAGNPYHSESKKGGWNKKTEFNGRVR